MISEDLYANVAEKYPNAEKRTVKLRGKQDATVLRVIR